MKTLNKKFIDHLGDDFENQTLLEKKRRIDAQITLYIGLYSSRDLNVKEEELIVDTLHYLITLQNHFSKLIRFIEAINYN